MITQILEERWMDKAKEMEGRIANLEKKLNEEIN